MVEFTNRYVIVGKQNLAHETHLFTDPTKEVYIRGSKTKVGMHMSAAHVR